MSKYLHYDSENMWADSVGAFGIERGAVEVHAKKLEEVNRRLKDVRESGDQGFFDLPHKKKRAEAIVEKAEQIKDHFETLVVVGIGGSNLGAKSLISSLGNEQEGLEVVFFDNPDPDDIQEKLKKIDWENTVINVVSKSGTTLETVSIFTFLRKSLIEVVGVEKHAEHIFVTTDPETGALYEIAQEYGYEILPHPLNVGGRFAVLSVVGLFPAACAGVDVQGLLAGARWLDEAHQKEGVNHAAVEFSILHYLAYTKHNQHIHVLMPYTSKIFDIGLWFRQLWAESLGKKQNNTNVGPTPIAALGSVDQHSQIQLYNHGPNDKVITFLEIKRFQNNEIAVPDTWKDRDDIGYMATRGFQEIMHAERSGTAKALKDNDRPNGTIYLSERSPESIGALLYFYELATVYMAALLDINPYNQPGVEAGKEAIRASLDHNKEK